MLTENRPFIPPDQKENELYNHDISTREDKGVQIMMIGLDHKFYGRESGKFAASAGNSECWKHRNTMIKILVH